MAPTQRPLPLTDLQTYAAVHVQKLRHDAPLLDAAWARLNEVQYLFQSLRNDGFEGLAPLGERIERSTIESVGVAANKMRQLDRQLGERMASAYPLVSQLVLGRPAPSAWDRQQLERAEANGRAPGADLLQTADDLALLGRAASYFVIGQVDPTNVRDGRFVFDVHTGVSPDWHWQLEGAEIDGLVGKSYGQTSGLAADLPS